MQPRKFKITFTGKATVFIHNDFKDLDYQREDIESFIEDAESLIIEKLPELFSSVEINLQPESIQEMN